MIDIAPELWEAIQKAYRSGKAANPALKKLLANKSLSYAEAQQIASLLGGEAGKALTVILTETALPDGRLYYNIAERTVKPLLESVYSDVADVGEVAQTAQNAINGINIKAIRPELNKDRIDGFLEKLTEAEKITDVDWLFGASVENFARSVIDDGVRENGYFHESAGLETVFTRYSIGKCCDWCDSANGTYSSYSQLPPNFFQRHDFCNCVIDTKTKSGSRRNIWGSQTGQATRATQKRLAKQSR